MRSPVRLLPLCAAAALLFDATLQAQSPVLLELQNAAAADRLVVDSAGGMVVKGTFEVGAIPASGEGTRMMWYPGKGAFRAGSVTETHWDNSYVGNYSVATGFNTTASGYTSTAMGTSTTASAYSSTAMGFETTAQGESSTAMGANTVATVYASTAMGANTTASGWVSTAMGAFASTNGMSGAFVYGDNSTTGLITATVPYQFSVRASGGVRFFTNSGLTAGATLLPGGGTWNAVSDRARKEHFMAVDGEDVLARIRTLPITTWRYLAEEDRSVRHIGPMAQDWHRAFGFSADSLHINSGDLDGVSLAGVQALVTRTDWLAAEHVRARRERGAQDERIRELEAENRSLSARLERVEQMLAATAVEP